MTPLAAGLRELGVTVDLLFLGNLRRPAGLLSAGTSRGLVTMPARILSWGSPVWAAARTRAHEPGCSSVSTSVNRPGLSV